MVAMPTLLMLPLMLLPPLQLLPPLLLPPLLLPPLLLPPLLLLLLPPLLPLLLLLLPLLLLPLSQDVRHRSVNRVNGVRRCSQSPPRNPPQASFNGPRRRPLATRPVAGPGKRTQPMDDT